MGLVTEYKTESKYLKAADLAEHGWEWTLTIDGVTEAEFDDGRKQPALLFKETPKMLGLNYTNRTTLAELFGRPNAQGVMDVEPGDLEGKVVSAYKTQTKSSTGAMVDCVRLRFPRVAAYNAATGGPPPIKAGETFTPEQQAAASAALTWLDSIKGQTLTAADVAPAKAHAAAIGANTGNAKSLVDAVRVIRQRAEAIANTLTIVPVGGDIPF